MKQVHSAPLFAALLASGSPVLAQSDSSKQDIQATPVADKRPNVLIWMLDDVGFAQMSAFGGLIETPNIDRVAAAGLRYTNYNSTPICSASRAALLTGRNSHSVHMGGHAAAFRPFPGYDGVIPPQDATVAANFRSAGYITFALGKWDHLPTRMMTPAGPFSLWPLGQGFDRFFGFLAPDTDNWQPMLMQDNAPIQASSDPDYHLDRDLSAKAIEMIAARSAQEIKRPFFAYYATGTAHAPHHAPQSWIDHYKGKFDDGWDVARERILARQIETGLIPAGTKLAPRPAEMPEWASLSTEEKRLYARQMEVFAASLSHADEQFGKLLDALERSGELDNTIVLITTDNGASAEGARDGTYNEVLFTNARTPSVAENMPYYDKWGGRDTYPHYSFGWAVAGNTPFRYYKQTAHQGGTRVPLVVSWPRGIAARGELRGQFVHVSDIAPTLMQLSGVPLARILNDVPQSPMEGLSFGYTLANASAPDRKRAQYFEMYGNKALWSGGWSIVTTHRTQTWDMSDLSPANEPWELYDLRTDPGQTVNLASKFPKKVAQLSAEFDRQAKKYNVYPIGNIAESRPFENKLREAEMIRRDSKWIFPSPVSHIAERAGPPITLMPFKMTATVGLETGRETGPIFARGGAMGGIALHLRDGVPILTLRSLVGSTRYEIVGDRSLGKGETLLGLNIGRVPAANGQPAKVTVTLLRDGQIIGERAVEYIMPATYGVAETFDIGIDWGNAVSGDYVPGRPFGGKISNIVFDFSRPRS